METTYIFIGILGIAILAALANLLIDTKKKPKYKSPEQEREEYIESKLKEVGDLSHFNLGSITLIVFKLGFIFAIAGFMWYQVGDIFQEQLGIGMNQNVSTEGLNSASETIMPEGPTIMAIMIIIAGIFIMFNGSRRLGLV